MAFVALQNGWSGCWLGAGKGHVEVVRALIEAGADVNQARTDIVVPAICAIIQDPTAVETVFSRLYGNFMPGVMNILTNCSSPQQ